MEGVAWPPLPDEQRMPPATLSKGRRGPQCARKPNHSPRLRRACIRRASARRSRGRRRDDHAQDHGRGHGAANALNEPCRYEHRGTPRNSAQERGGGKEGQANQKYTLAADEIAEPSSQKEEATEGDQVSVDHPGEARL